MAGVIYIDADAVINAIKAGRALGNPTAILDRWAALAAQTGAQIRITDVVQAEVGIDGSILASWMQANEITADTTGMLGQSGADLGERSIFSEIRQQMQNTGASASDFMIISDNKSQLMDQQFVRNNLGIPNTAEGNIAVSEFIYNNVSNSAQTLNVADAATGVPYDQFQAEVSAYRSIPKFDSSSVQFDRTQQFIQNETDYTATEAVISEGSGTGPTKFGGVTPTDAAGSLNSGLQQLVQDTINGIAQDITNLKGALAVLGEAAVIADFIRTTTQAYSILTDSSRSLSDRLNSAGEILTQFEGRVALGIEGAVIGDAIGQALGGFLANLADQALAATILGAAEEGALEGAYLGIEFGPVGVAVGGLMGLLIGATLGSIEGTQFGSAFWKAANDGLGMLRSAFAAGAAALDAANNRSIALFGPFGRLYPSPPNPRDPLVLDLTGNGIQLTSVVGSGAHFDFSGTGAAAQTGWISQGEGLLMLANGTGGYELLGAQSGSGFGDLAALDANADGVINVADAAFANLRVWVDANGDGIIDAGEIKTLAGC